MCTHVGDNICWSLNPGNAYVSATVSAEQAQWSPGVLDTHPLCNAGASSRPVSILYRGGGAAAPSASGLAPSDADAAASEDPYVRWLAAAGYPPAEAAAALAATGGDREAALHELYSAWTGASHLTCVVLMMLPKFLHTRHSCILPRTNAHASAGVHKHSATNICLRTRAANHKQAEPVLSS